MREDNIQQVFKQKEAAREQARTMAKSFSQAYLVNPKH